MEDLERGPDGDGGDVEHAARGEGGAAAGPGRGTAPEVMLRDDADRQEVLQAAPDGRALVRVRARSRSAREPVRAEAQLLAALEVDTLVAAPAVLEIEDDGYVREAASAVRRRTGRHADPAAGPGTEERIALSRARDHLESLIDGMHERGWVLGAPPGGGLGVRADGSVTVRDLSGLRVEDSTTARLEDRMWIDSVLRDQDRTLRRRIDAPVAVATPEPETPPSGPVPSARTSSARRGRTRVVGSRLRSRLAVAAVVVAGVMLGVGTWQLVPPAQGPAGAPPSGQAGPAVRGSDPHSAEATTEPAPTARPAPARRTRVIAEPERLATELSRDRHAYVTGRSAAPVTVAGSTAEQEDRQVREAYGGRRVRGGEPVVHTASVVAGPTGAGTAQLQVEISTPAHEVSTADGSARTVAATGPTVVELHLRWDGSRWRVAQVVPA